MHRRYERNHIPIELLRTLVVIEAEGSFTKAGAVLGLTQSAVSAQVRRFEQLIGDDIFVKTGGGLSLTPVGASIAQYAHRILQINDQILSLPSAQSSKGLIRIGISSSLAQLLLLNLHRRCRDFAKGNKIRLRCDDSRILIKSVEDGYLDIAVVFAGPGQLADAVDQWFEMLNWACSPDLLVSPNDRVPYISWPNSAIDDFAIGALERIGRSYFVAFASPDFDARLIAARAGFGYLLLPERTISSGLKVARESFLPRLSPMRAGVVVRRDFDRNSAKDLIQTIVNVARPAEPALPGADRMPGLQTWPAVQ